MSERDSSASSSGVATGAPSRARTAYGATAVCVSDSAAGRGRAAIASLLAVAAVHERLVERGLRTACSLLVASDEARDTHMVAALLGYGADVVCPRLALETVARLAASDKVGGDRPSPEEAQARLLQALELGVLKVMSKAGISDVASYRGARLFEAVGLDRRLCRRFFGGTPSAIGGIGLERLEADALERLAASNAEKPALENPGFYKFRKGGERHATEPEVVAALEFDILFGRLHEPKNWSPSMVPSDEFTSLVIEYFCSFGDHIWEMTEEELVENAVKHGLARKVGAGHITIRAWREHDSAVIEVEDDGLGISEERLPSAMTSGIGLNNDNERLRVLYGAEHRLSLSGAPGKGALARVIIPLVAPVRRMAS